MPWGQCYVLFRAAPSSVTIRILLKYYRKCHRCHGRILCLTDVHIGKFMQTGENEWCRKFLTFLYGRKTARRGPQQINLTKQDHLWERRELLKNKTLGKHNQEEESFYKDTTQWRKSSKQVHLWWDISPHVNKWLRKYIETSLLLLLHCFLFCLFVLSCRFSMYLIGMLKNMPLFLFVGTIVY